MDARLQTHMRKRNPIPPRSCKCHVPEFAGVRPPAGIMALQGAGDAFETPFPWSRNEPDAVAPRFRYRVSTKC